MARILVIEDNVGNRELMTYLLNAFGHTPLSAANGEVGVAIARRERPDVIVCDVQLPRMHGYEIAQLLKNDPATDTIMLVAVTALAMRGDREQILAAGFDGYITKPIIPETFVGQLEAFLEADQRTVYAPFVAQLSPPEIARSPLQTRGTILVVDDSPLNHELLRGILESFGYAVLEAMGGYEALALARAWMPDLIVSDLHMPQGSGFDLIRAIKADPQLRQLKVVIHSATMISERDRREVLSLGAQTFIGYPIEPQLLLAEIESCLQMK
jgi:two-component system cell cycle response regulator